jgi:opacity protein-like surface antigen
MRRILLFVLLAAAVVAAAAPAQAQRRRYREYDNHPAGFEGRTLLSLHVGLSSPTGDFDNFFNSGLGVGGSIDYGISPDVLLGFEISHHSFDGDLPGDDANITPMTFNAEYIVPVVGNVKPFVGGGIGAYRHHEAIEQLDASIVEDTETTFGFNLGGGIAGRVGRQTLLGGGVRFHHVDGDRLPEANFFTFQVGLGFVL